MTFDGFTKISSGHIDAARYDSMDQKLTIRFSNGAHYVVQGVSPEDYRGFLDAPSQGEHYHSVIKQNFHVERVK